MRCSYCNLACEFSIATDDIGITGIEYLKSSNNEGRLCARGCANEILLKSGNRLTYPIVDNLPGCWDDALSKITDLITKYRDKTVITVGSELTIDEFELITGLGKNLTVPVIPINLDGGAGLRYQLKGIKKGNLKDLRDVDRLVTIGDIFSISPVLAYYILQFRNQKSHKHYHLDSLPSRTQSFADVYIPLSLNNEVSDLLSLAQGKLADCGLLEDLKDKTSLFIIALNTARTADPITFSLAAQNLARQLKGKVIFTANNLGWPGEGSLTDLFDGIKNGRFKLVLNFGDELLRFTDNLKGVRLISTSTIKVKTKRNWILLPAPINCEKTGSIRGLSGIEKSEGFTPPSGVHQIEQLLRQIGKSLEIDIKKTTYKPDVWVEDDSLSDLVQENRVRKSKESFTLYGFNNPLNFRDLFDYPQILLLNPEDLAKLKLSDYNHTDVGRKNYRVEAMVRRNSMIPRGTAAITVESSSTWPLFKIIKGFLVPSEVKVWSRRST